MITDGDIRNFDIYTFNRRKERHFKILRDF